MSQPAGRYVDCEVTGEVELDGAAFARCTFRDAILIYRGGDAPEFMDCDLRGCTVRFAGPAQRTLALLGAFGATELRQVTAMAVHDIFNAAVKTQAQSQADLAA